MKPSERTKQVEKAVIYVNERSKQGLKSLQEKVESRSYVIKMPKFKARVYNMVLRVYKEKRNILITEASSLFGIKESTIEMILNDKNNPLTA